MNTEWCLLFYPHTCLTDAAWASWAQAFGAAAAIIAAFLIGNQQTKTARRLERERYAGRVRGTAAMLRQVRSAIGTVLDERRTTSPDAQTLNTAKSTVISAGDIMRNSTLGRSESALESEIIVRAHDLITPIFALAFSDPSNAEAGAQLEAIAATFDVDAQRLEQFAEDLEQTRRATRPL